MIAINWSPSTRLPSASTARQRSASPSCAMPRSAPMLDDCFLQVFDMGRATTVVDVVAVGFTVDLDDVGAGLAVRERADMAHCAVRAIDHDGQSLQGHGQAGQKMADVLAVRGGVGHDATDGVADRPVPGLPQAGLDLGLDMIGSLLPSAVKNLIPLSGMALWEADSMTPRSARRALVKYATAGVGRTPTSMTSTPALARPADTAACRNSPLARGSRPTTAVRREPTSDRM